MAARKEMRRLGIDLADGWLRSLLKRLHLLSGHRVGDRAKSWDVLQTVNFLSQHLDEAEPVLDIGAYASEILPALNRTGYTSLSGIDLNPDIVLMPENNRIKYMIGDFYESGLPSGSFSAITAISVIEHGFKGERLLTEVSRLLSPGGYFIASVDYWPDKIDTTGITPFGLEWMVFSQTEIEVLVMDAARLGLVPVGDLDFAAHHPLISWQGKSYTFAWLALKKVENSLNSI